MNYYLINAAAIENSGLPVTVRGHSFDFSPKFVEELRNRKSLRRLYVFPTQTSLISNLGGAVRAAPVVFDPRQYYPQDQATKDRRLVVRTGIALPTKDCEGFIEAAALCKNHRFQLFTCRALGNPSYLDKVLARNVELGSPVDIVLDRPASEVAKAVRQAGIYLHSYNPENATFGMPISIAEAMATGAYVLARRSPHGVDYLGTEERLYERPDEAALKIQATLDWDAERWRSEANFSIERAFSHHRPAIAAGPILEDWLSFTNGLMLARRSGEKLVEITAGSTWTFGQGQQGLEMLRTGFHAGEDWGVWIGSRTATLAFMLGDGPAPTKIELVSWIPGSRRAAIALLLNGMLLGSQLVGPHASYIYDLSHVRLERGQPCLLEFAFGGDAYMPRSEGSLDPRRLMAPLMSLTFV